MTTTVKITPRGTVTLPMKLRRRYGLKANDLLIAECTEQGILLRPASVLPTEIYTKSRMAEFDDKNNRDIAAWFPDRSGNQPSQTSVEKPGSRHARPPHL